MGAIDAWLYYSFLTLFPLKVFSRFHYAVFIHLDSPGNLLTIQWYFCSICSPFLRGRHESVIIHVVTKKECEGAMHYEFTSQPFTRIIWENEFPDLGSLCLWEVAIDPFGGWEGGISWVHERLSCEHCLKQNKTNLNSCRWCVIHITLPSCYIANQSAWLQLIRFK
jgi:hypothetical protein